MPDPIGRYMEWLDAQDNVTLIVLNFFGLVALLVGLVCFGVWVTS